MTTGGTWVDMGPIALLILLGGFALGLPLAFVVGRTRARRLLAPAGAILLVAALVAAALALVDRAAPEPLYLGALSLALAAAIGATLLLRRGERAAAG